VRETLLQVSADLDLRLRVAGQDIPGPWLAL
jgi:hypothetical protein